MKRMRLSIVLDAERQRQKLSYRKLAVRTEVPFDSVYRILTNPECNPSHFAVVSILHGLGRSLSWLEKRMGK